MLVGIVWSVLFALYVAGAIYIIDYIRPQQSCEHLYWVDGDEQIRCLRCG